MSVFYNGSRRGKGTFLGGEKSSAKAAKRGSKEARESKRQADAQAAGGKEAVAENARETEIMTLFAKGRNLAYIQEQLCLSKSTVSTHRQHIYQKLGIHSIQEMIDLIQEEKA